MGYSTGMTRLPALWLGLCLLLLSPLSAEGQEDSKSEERKEPRILGLSPRIEGQQVLGSFRLVDAFDENLLKRIESGIPSGFTFSFQMVRDRKSWFDKGLLSSQLRVDAMFNAVTRTYLINFKHDGQLIESRVVRDLDELRQAMCEYESFPLFEVSREQMGQRLRLRARALLGTHHIFFFIPRDTTTGWAESRLFQIALPGESSER